MKVNKFQYAPDADATGAASGDGKKPVPTKSIPQADIDFMDVSKTIGQNWEANPNITLLWKKEGEFNADVQAYAASLTGRIDTGALRPGQTLTLMQLDQQIDTAAGEVKTYIEGKYKKANAPAQFARFGLPKSSAGYIMSRDRNNRNSALDQMIKSIADEGFGDREFGNAFWTGIKKSYEAALKLASNTTGDISGKVATKNELKKAITKVMSALMFVLRGNYPDTYKEIYRQWGWKKESY